MKFPRLFFVVVAALPLSAAVGRAQAPEKKADPPATRKPPAGMCRIWVDGVPADKQPAPTDCTNALRNKPTNGQVIFGDPKPPAKFGTGSAASRSMMPPVQNGFAPPRPAARGSHDTPPPKSGHDSSKAGRDSNKTGHDSAAKKPPPHHH